MLERRGGRNKGRWRRSAGAAEAVCVMTTVFSWTRLCFGLFSRKSVEQNDWPTFSPPPLPPPLSRMSTVIYTHELLPIITRHTPLQHVCVCVCVWLRARYMSAVSACVIPRMVDCLILQCVRSYGRLVYIYICMCVHGGLINVTYRL